jgi:phosphoribosylamine--glycine ligase
MKVLLLGSGGREHALAWKIAQSPKVEKLYIAPGNAGTSEAGENVNLKATDFPALKAFALEKEIDMIVVGPEDPLVQGIFDSSRKTLPPAISTSSAPPPKVPHWKVARNLPKAS